MYRVDYDQIVREKGKFFNEMASSFDPYTPHFEETDRIFKSYTELLKTQNGSDIDDYVVGDNNKVEKFLDIYERTSKVLLLGTGTGREVLVAKDMGFTAVGTTFGSYNVSFGKSILGLKETELLECNNDSLPFMKESFDIIAGFQVFEHCISPLLFLLEQSRVLKTGGTLLLEWPPGKLFSMDENPHHQICYTPFQAKVLFMKAGFSNIDIFYDDLTEIPEDKIYSEDHDKMLCIKGIKIFDQREYVLTIRRR